VAAAVQRLLALLDGLCKRLRESNIAVVNLSPGAVA